MKGQGTNKKSRKPIPVVEVRVGPLLKVDKGVEEVVMDRHTQIGWGKK